MHYQRNLKHGSPHTVLLEVDKNRDPICTIGGCKSKHESKGYCGRHYSSFLRFGDPLAAREYDVEIDANRTVTFTKKEIQPYGR